MELESCATAGKKFDVFLSHSSAGPGEILPGVKAMPEYPGRSVYLDNSDPHMSPFKVTIKTAEIVRRRIGQSNALLYIHGHTPRGRERCR